MQKCDQYPCPTCTYGMPKGYSAPINVNPVKIQVQFPVNRYALRCKGFIDLYQVKLTQSYTSALDSFSGCTNRAHTHYFRRNSTEPIAFDGCHGIKAFFFCLFFRHQKNSSSTIIDT